MPDLVTRRDILAAAGSTTTLGLSGCLGNTIECGTGEDAIESLTDIESPTDVSVQGTVEEIGDQSVLIDDGTGRAVLYYGRHAIIETNGMQGNCVKYLGDKPRGFTVLSVPSRNGRTDAGEFNSPRPSRNGLAGINTRTLVVSVRVGRSTTTRQLPSHHAEDAGFERSRISKLPQSALD